MPKTYLGSNALDDPDLAASQVTSGTFDDARIPAGITRDSELDTEVTDLATAIADGDASTLTSAQSYADGKVAQSITNGVTTSAPSQDQVFDALALKAVDADVVHDTGNETIAGVKTFSSDPIVPDEAYSSGWNGVLEPPTKNAVYDKIESLAAETQWLPAQVFTVMGVGTPPFSGSAASTFGGYGMDSASTESVSVPWVAPPNWATYHVDVYWSAATGTGDVVWSLVRRVGGGDGADLTATEGTTPQITATAPGNNVLGVDRLASSLSCTPGNVITLRPSRVGGDAADTMTGDAQFIGLLLTKAT